MTQIDRKDLIDIYNIRFIYICIYIYIYIYICIQRWLIHLTQLQTVGEL